MCKICYGSRTVRYHEFFLNFNLKEFCNSKNISIQFAMKGDWYDFKAQLVLHDTNAMQEYVMKVEWQDTQQGLTVLACYQDF